MSRPYLARTFHADEALIAWAFADKLSGIHHVGSISVPGRAATPEISAPIEAREHGNTPTQDEVLMGSGYVRGNDLTMNHLLYRRNH
ncbi:GrpB family protein [Pseudomonas putida]|uniref:GrpB family protein n=1 Tax=Pseudomonas putida TaxID=303 RepID=UPI0035713EEE